MVAEKVIGMKFIEELFVLILVALRKHKISPLQKIKQLKKNMVCKYKFVLMNNEYNLYFNYFTKEYPLILFSLNGIHNKSLALSLLEIYCSLSLRM